MECFLYFFKISDEWLCCVRACVYVEIILASTREKISKPSTCDLWRGHSWLLSLLRNGEAQRICLKQLYLRGMEAIVPIAAFWVVPLQFRGPRSAVLHFLCMQFIKAGGIFVLSPKWLCGGYNIYKVLHHVLIFQIIWYSAWGIAQIFLNLHNQVPKSRP